jgi:hypothetical protein
MSSTTLYCLQYCGWAMVPLTALISFVLLGIDEVRYQFESNCVCVAYTFWPPAPTWAGGPCCASTAAAANLIIHVCVCIWLGLRGQGWEHGVQGVTSHVAPLLVIMMRYCKRSCNGVFELCPIMSCIMRARLDWVPECAP